MHTHTHTHTHTCVCIHWVYVYTNSIPTHTHTHAHSGIDFALCPASTRNRHHRRVPSTSRVRATLKCEFCGYPAATECPAADTEHTKDTVKGKCLSWWGLGMPALTMMYIRLTSKRRFAPRDIICVLREICRKEMSVSPVSYTHLTLPTILRV